MSYKIVAECKSAEDLFKVLGDIPQEYRKRMIVNWEGVHVNGFLIENEHCPNFVEFHSGLIIREMR